MIMAKTLIGNIKGSNGRGISKIEKTATTGDVDTYTITYTDSTTSTYDVHNADAIAVQRQIVPSAEIESSATATKSYGVGDYLILNGVLRKVTAAIEKGATISDSNSTATTVTGELATKVLATGTTAILGASYKVTATACGKTVCIEATATAGFLSSDGAQSTKSDVVITIPDGYRPSVPTSNSYMVMSPVCDLRFGKTIGFVIYADGTVRLICTSNRGMSDLGADSFCIAYIVR